MAIQGIKRNILELLFSTDKKIQDFFSSVKQGDILKGRIIEVFPNDNKAIINFKGFNIISQVPENFNLTKGETINVIVSQINDKIQMKILNGITDPLNQMEVAKSNIANINNLLLSKTENYINILKSINIPVNEQNLYIVQKLIDYSIPVNKENIFDITNKLMNYFEKKGIDIRALNITNQDLAKEIMLDNIIKFVKNADALIENMNFIAGRYKNSQNINYQDIDIQNIKDSTIRLINLLNISKIISQTTSDINFTINNDSIVFQFQNKGKQLNIQDILDNLKNIKVNIENDKNSVKINIDNIYNTLKNITDNIIKTVPGDKQFVPILEQFLNNLKEIIKPQKNDTQQIFNLKDNIYSNLNIFNGNGNRFINELKENFILLKQNIFSTNHINVQNGIKDAINLTLTINQVANELSKNLNLYIDDSAQINKNDIIFIKKELDSIINFAKNIINKIDISKSEYKPVELLDIHSNLKSFINNLDGLRILKEGKSIEIINKNNIVNLIDVESTLEAIIFLKSRSLSLEKTDFIDLMQKYFQNGMKLNQNIEYLLINIEKFEKNFIKEKNNTEFNNLYRIIQDIKNIFYKIAISTDENILNPNDMKNQIMNFIQKSGINLEARIKDLLSAEIKANTITTIKDAINPQDKGVNNNINIKGTHINELRDNLKSQLIKLENILDKINTTKYDSEHKEIINNFKKSAGDLLTNLNALQFINQKPLAFDMLYAQLPVFINNKFFNGEIQVWYRKGSLKQNMDSTEPLNIVFLLNTSNLGNVKISMFVHKNDVECIIKTENDKTKQILNRNKEEFLNNINEMNYKIKNFVIKVENDLNSQSEELGDGYINIGKIDLKA